MIITVDTICLFGEGKYTGTGVYLSGVLTELLRLAERSGNGATFHTFVDPVDNWAGNGFVSPFLRVHQTRALRYLWRYGGMALQSARTKPDLVFLPTAHHSFPSPGIPTVTTILDAIPRRLPEGMVPGGMRLHFKTWLNAKLATKILTISEHSKRDIMELYGLRTDQVAVTYLGYDQGRYNVVPPDPKIVSALLERLGIRRPFVLHHGMVQVRKNVHRLVKAWDLLRERHRDFNLQLVLAGPLGWRHEEVLKIREASRFRDDVILTTTLSANDLSALVKSAFVCVIPSLYEGFCLPMVEAMACGIPTVASSASCLPEVSGGVLKYFDPTSVDDIANTMMSAIVDSKLRDELRDRGLRRSAEFNWKRCAAETLQVFSSVVQ